MTVGFTRDSISPSAQKQRRQRLKEKRAAVSRKGLNINSMMDMMTIILVFLIDSYGSNPIQVTESPDLLMPRSTTQLAPEDTLQIAITRNSLVVGDTQVASVVQGTIEPSRLRGLTIAPLFDRLSDEVQRHKQIAKLRHHDFEGVVTIVADKHTPYRLITQVMYTAGQAQLSKFKFAVVRKEQNTL